MLNLADKSTKNNNIKNSEQNTLTISDIEKFYKKNYNSKNQIGVEYERISLDKNTYLNADYEKISKILIDYSNISKWDLVYDKETIIGVKDNFGNSISLEPGLQMEISLVPMESVLDIDIKLSKIVNLLDKIADLYDVVFLGYGITPKSSVDSIRLLDKRRYKIMNNYLPNCKYGELCPKMMRQTAGIQINIDYKNNNDAYNKLKFFNLVMPFVSGLFSNSPISNNTKTDFKSVRSHVWMFTGQNRCNLFYEDVFKGFFNKKNLVKNYISKVIDVPMVFIERNDEIIEINGKITFRDFMKDGFKGYFPTYDDYILHQSLCFPDVRYKNYIEIRNHDSNDLKTTLSLCAFYKGLLVEDFDYLLDKFKYLKLDKVEQYFKKSSRQGLDFTIENKSAWEIVENLFLISSMNLDSKERIYLNPVYTMIKTRKTTADIILDYGYKNADDVVDFLLK